MSPSDVPNEFLRSTDVIDWQDDSIRGLAEELKLDSPNERALIRSSFEWVRDNIQHCIDYDRDEITCLASDVLKFGAGFCYAKSHLLAALLRANGIPAGLCYQRLRMDDETSPLCVHGLNAVFVPEHGWYRIDPRGNKPGVDAQFQPPREKLAFSTEMEGEEDYPDVWAEPIQSVVEALNAATSARAMAQDVPDMPPNEYFAAKNQASICNVPFTGAGT